MGVSIKPTDNCTLWTQFRLSSSPTISIIDNSLAGRVFVLEPHRLFPRVLETLTWYGLTTTGWKDTEPRPSERERKVEWALGSSMSPNLYRSRSFLLSLLPSLLRFLHPIRVMKSSQELLHSYLLPEKLLLSWAREKRQPASVLYSTYQSSSY